jgi:hypothetical protein
MSRDTVTVKFRGGGPQSTMLSRLEAFCRQLVVEHGALQATPRAVFPGHREARLASIFTVVLVNPEPNVSRRFRALPDLEYAKPAPPRRSLGRTTG